MSLVSQNEWYRWLGDMPMPEDATKEMMMAAVYALEEMERQDEAIRGIKFFTDMQERDQKKLKEAKEWGDIDLTETIEHVIKTEDEIIEKYRSWLQ